MFFKQNISEKMLRTHGVLRKDVIKELKSAETTLKETYRDVPEMNRRQIVVRFFRLHKDDSEGICWTFDDTAIETNYSDLNCPAAEFFIIATLQRIDL